jgi:hypothetical protein
LFFSFFPLKSFFFFFFNWVLVLPINLASLVVFHRNLVCYITPNSFWLVVVTWPDVRPLKGIDCCFCFWVADIYHSTIQVSFLFNVFRRRLVDNSCQRLSTTFLSRKISALYSIFHVRVSFFGKWKKEFCWISKSGVIF